MHQRCLTQSPPPLPPPHKGEGNTIEYEGRGSAPSGRGKCTAYWRKVHRVRGKVRWRTQRRLARSYVRDQRGPRPMLKAPMLLAAVLVVCVASSADARRHHGYYGYGESAPTLDNWRRARDAQSQGQDRGQGSGQDQAQGQGQDQKQDQRQGQAQDSRQDQRQDRVQDRRDYRARERGDRRRARSLDEWRRSRETQSQGQESGAQ